MGAVLARLQCLSGQIMNSVSYLIMIRSNLVQDTTNEYITSI